MALDFTERRCAGPCKLIKHVNDFYPRTDPESGEVIGVSRVCKKCDEARWKTARDGGTDVPQLYDNYGNLKVPGKQVFQLKVFTEQVQLAAIEQIKEDRSLQLCADTIGVTLQTLRSWLEDEREPFASWARRFRIARAKKHKGPIEEALIQEAKAGNVRAIEFALTTGFPDEYGKKKQEVDLTVRKGSDELDPNQYTADELRTLHALLNKGKPDE